MILIEKDKAVEALHQWEQDYTWDDYDAKYSPSVVSPSDAIEGLPTIEIVRCRECRHRDPEDKKCDCGHFIVWQLARDDDWYCADGAAEPDL